MSKRILIMTDSSNTISQETAKKYGIQILPLTLQRSDGIIFNDVPSDINHDQILEMLGQNYTFKTATTAYGIMQQMIENALEEYDQILICPISKGWSSQTSHLQNIAKEFPNRVFVANTNDFGYALECLCIDLAKKVERGCEIDELLEYADNYWKHSITFFACKTLKGLQKSGRLPKVFATILSITKIFPIIKAEYNNQKECVAMGWSHVPDKFIKSIDKTFNNQLNNDDIEHICILISEAQSSDIDHLKQLLCQTYNIPAEKIVLRWAPSVFLCFVWKGAIGVTVVSKQEKSIIPSITN